METEDFEIGDRVTGEYDNGTIFSGTVRNIVDGDAVEVERDDRKTGGGILYKGRKLWRCCLRDGQVHSDGSFGAPLRFEGSDQTQSHQGGKMKLDQIKKENLKEAEKQYNEEKKNEEIEFAKNEIRRAKDQINMLDRQIKDREEQKKPYLEILAKFK